MVCASCGGHVTWRGPITNLTQTECADCGAINNQLVDQPNEQEDDEE
jgi:DNA-directed RNA polymerase subunit RPC12/RpoP